MSSDEFETKFVIVCEDESAFLTNSRTNVHWSALDELVLTLVRFSNFSDESNLFNWKKRPGRIASAREAYAWRGALEEIKNSDLTERCAEFRTDPKKFVLITDKPAMLKIAGEVTNSLLHSNAKRHRISFSPLQKTSNVPS